MAKRIRQDCAQLNLRLETAERERVRAAIPRGSFNVVAVQLLMDYVQMIETRRPHINLPQEDSAA